MTASGSGRRQHQVDRASVMRRHLSPDNSAGRSDEKRLVLWIGLAGALALVWVVASLL